MKLKIPHNYTSKKRHFLRKYIKQSTKLPHKTKIYKKTHLLLIIPLKTLKEINDHYINDKRTPNS